MRNVLIPIFSITLIMMVAMTVRASLACSITEVPETVLRDVWFHATLTDAYLGFLTFYVWVAYRESHWISRVVWFVLIMGLGNIAMSAYVLIKLFALSKDASTIDLLLRPSDVSSIATKA